MVLRSAWMVSALLLAAALACSAAAAPIAMSRRMLQAPSLPGGPRTLTVINRCSQELKVAIAYPFDHSDPTQGGWCTNPDAWQTGWCYERGRPLAPGATLTSMETTQPLPPAPTAFVTAYRHDHLDVYVPGERNAQPQTQKGWCNGPRDGGRGSKACWRFQFKCSEPAVSTNVEV
jgi:hypothetical protein